MLDGEADWTAEGRPAGPCVRQARQGVGGRRRPGEAAPRALLGGDTRRVKASRPLIRVLVINDNGLWINDFI